MFRITHNAFIKGCEKTFEYFPQLSCMLVQLGVVKDENANSRWMNDRRRGESRMMRLGSSFHLPLMFPRSALRYFTAIVARQQRRRERRRPGGFARWKMKFSATKRGACLEYATRGELDRNFPGTRPRETTGHFAWDGRRQPVLLLNFS